MIRLATLGLLAALLFGCAPAGEVTDADQKSNEQKYSQAGYEDAMRKAGRDKELEEQKRLAAERQQGER